MPCFGSKTFFLRKIRTYILRRPAYTDKAITRLRFPKELLHAGKLPAILPCRREI